MLYSQDYPTHGDLLTIAESDLRVLGPGILKIMQYTGLKDKNGREIYEGDIIQFLDRDWIDYEKDTLIRATERLIKDAEEVFGKEEQKELV